MSFIKRVSTRKRILLALIIRRVDTNVGNEDAVRNHSKDQTEEEWNMLMLAVYLPSI